MHMNMQKLYLIGRATKDAEIVETKNNKSFVKFSLAVNRYIKGAKDSEVSFFDCLYFMESHVDKIGERVKKGDLIFAEGRPEVEAYLSKSGEAKATLKVILNDLQVIK